jgi:hypothetical protein
MRSKIFFWIESNPGDTGLTQWALKKTHTPAEPVIVGDGEKTPGYLFGSCRFTNRDRRQKAQTGCERIPCFHYVS